MTSSHEGIRTRLIEICGGKEEATIEIMDLNATFSEAELKKIPGYIQDKQGWSIEYMYHDEEYPTYSMSVLLESVIAIARGGYILVSNPSLGDRADLYMRMLSAKGFVPTERSDDQPPAFRLVVD